MTELDKTAFANKTTRLMGGRNRLTLYAAALIVLIAVAVAGALLASRASMLREELMKTQIMESLTSSVQKSRITQIFSDRENTKLLLAYINSFAGAVGNLEVTPGWRFNQFIALLDAANASQVTMEAFHADGSMLTITCKGQAENALQLFAEALGETGFFSRVDAVALSNADEGEFTTKCYFI